MFLARFRARAAPSLSPFPSFSLTAPGYFGVLARIYENTRRSLHDLVKARILEALLPRKSRNSRTFKQSTGRKISIREANERMNARMRSASTFARETANIVNDALKYVVFLRIFLRPDRNPPLILANPSPGCSSSRRSPARSNAPRRCDECITTGRLHSTRRRAFFPMCTFPVGICKR